MLQKRDCWIDNVKAYACILVVLGHFVQSMITSDIVEPNFFATLFDDTIYYFHVPLFFICSGYLYQKYSCVSNFSHWKTNLFKKLLSLGIPYLTFSLITWIMKKVFSSAVNNKADGIFTSLFLKPISPYWYLYALFFLFLLTPTFKNRKTAYIISGIAIILKIISFLPFETEIYALNTVLDNEVWFVAGMEMSFLNFPVKGNDKKKIFMAACSGLLFVSGSTVLCLWDISAEPIEFLLGILGCISTILIMVVCEKFDLARKIGIWCAEFTLPVFLMHTIFAAAFRSLLFKVGITSAATHIIVGIAVSFVGPVIATKIMCKFKWMEFFLYPNKYIKPKKKTEE